MENNKYRSEEYAQKIEDFLLDRLSEEEEQDFMTEAQKDKILVSEIKKHQLIHQALREFQYKKDYQELEEQEIEKNYQERIRKGKIKKFFLFLGLAVIAVIAVYKPIKDIVFPTQEVITPIEKEQAIVDLYYPFTDFRVAGSDNVDDAILSALNLMEAKDSVSLENAEKLLLPIAFQDTAKYYLAHRFFLNDNYKTSIEYFEAILLNTSKRLPFVVEKRERLNLLLAYLKNDDYKKIKQYYSAWVSPIIDDPTSNFYKKYKKFDSFLQQNSKWKEFSSN